MVAPAGDGFTQQLNPPGAQGPVPDRKLFYINDMHYLNWRQELREPGVG